MSEVRKSTNSSADKLESRSKKNSRRTVLTKPENAAIFINMENNNINNNIDKHSLLTEKEELRFLEKYVANPTSGCFEWCASTNSKGYGLFRLRGKMVRAHRVCFTHHFGPIPPGMFVCHRCDNRKCIRPEHLFLGTHEDNMRDKADKGRAPSGSNHGMSRPKEHYETKPTTRGNFKTTCRRQGWEFDDFDEVFAGRNKQGQALYCYFQKKSNLNLGSTT